MIFTLNEELYSNFIESEQQCEMYFVEHETKKNKMITIKEQKLAWVLTFKAPILSYIDALKLMTKKKMKRKMIYHHMYVIQHHHHSVHTYDESIGIKKKNIENVREREKLKKLCD